MSDNHFKIDRGLTLKPQAGAPSNPQNGDLYYDTSLTKFRKYENGAWSNMAGTSGTVDRAINAQTGTTYTFALTDALGNGNNPLVTATNAAEQLYTVPPNSSVAFPVGAQIDVLSQGAGLVSITAGVGVTINSEFGTRMLQWSAATLIKTATNTWTLYGTGLTVFMAATGGTITTDGDYKVHSFTSSGTFQVTSGMGTIESLVIAGGGGGGGTASGAPGGGGAGGMRYTTPGAMYGIGSYTVTIGAGGAGGAASSPGGTGSNGSNSVFDTLTATGGGGGADSFLTNGSNGGSGGGGGGAGGSNPGGTGVAGQGNTGGTGNNGANGCGGGGGGAGSVGGTGSAPNAGNGGTGSSNSITGAAVTYASGGGGASSLGGNAGTASAGGGGNGNQSGVGGAGTANSGGGGGASGAVPNVGGAGGSGIVILRYKFQ